MRRSSARQARLSRRWRSEAQQHERALAPYAGLDDQIAALEAKLEKAREGHLRYLRHEQLAAGLPQAEQALEAAQRARAAAVAAYEKAVARLQRSESALRRAGA